MKTELAYYFDYIENVLGIRSVINFDQVHLNSTELSQHQSESALTSDVEIKKEIILLFVVENFLNFSSTEKDLLNKMIAAIKAPENTYHIIDFIELAQNQYREAKFVVCFSEDPKSTIELIFNRKPDVVTFSPRVLLHNIELKKQAWSDMQKAVHFVKSYPT